MTKRKKETSDSETDKDEDEDEGDESMDADEEQIESQSDEKVKISLIFVDGKRSWKCEWPECEKIIVRHDRAMKHYMTQHEHKKAFTCTHSKCGRTFSRNDQLKKHQKLYHQLFTCDVPNCDRTFTRKCDLTRHVKDHKKNPSLGQKKPRKSKFGRKNPTLTKEKQEEKWVIEEQSLRAKIELAFKNGETVTLKRDCRLNDDNLIEKRCTRCNVWKERTTRHFRIHCDNHTMCKPGKESFQNICRDCVNDPNPHDFVINFLAHYRDDGLTTEAFYAKLKEQNGRGKITGMPLLLKRNCDNGVGVHKINNQGNHHPDNVMLEVRELNVQQRDAIPSLEDSWADVFQKLNTWHMNEDYKFATWEDSFLEALQAQSNEFDKSDVATKHLPTIIKTQISNGILKDIKKKRLKELTLAERDKLSFQAYHYVVQQLAKQKYLCALSGIPLEHNPKYNQISLERLNNKLPHFSADGDMSNTVIICRLFNCKFRITPAKIWEYFINQPKIELSEAVKAKALKIMKHLQNVNAKTIWDNDIDHIFS
jgi:hypothetical protein